MLKTVEWKNYKAFDSGLIDIERLNILIGANNSGKTSVTRLIRTLSNTARVALFNTPRSKQPLDLADSDFEGNDFHQLLKSGSKDPLWISLVFGITEDDSRRLRATIERDLDRQVFVLSRIGLTSSSNVKRLTRRLRQDGAEWYEYEKAIVGIFEEGDKSHTSRREILDALATDIVVDRFGFNARETTESFFNIASSEVERLYNLIRTNFIENFKMVKSILTSLESQSSIELSFSISSQETLKEIDQSQSLSFVETMNLRVGVFALQVDSTTSDRSSSSEDEFDHRISYELQDRSKKPADSDNWFELSSEIFNPSRNIFSLFRNRSEILWVTSVERLMTFAARKVIENPFQHVDPSRTLPRYIILASEIESKSDSLSRAIFSLLDSPEGVSAFNALASEYGFQVKIDRLVSDAYTLRLSTPNNAYDGHSLASVGFGFTHLTPIIGFLAHSNSPANLIIEQPEAHLHPPLHATIMDGVIDYLNRNEDSRVFVETHSDHFLSRLERRMQEFQNVDEPSSGTEFTLNPKDVAINFCEQDELGNSKITRVEISETGSFSVPESFISSKLEDIWRA